MLEYFIENAQEINAFVQLLYCLRQSIEDLLNDDFYEPLEDYERKCLCLLDGVDVTACPERGCLVLECAIETGYRSLVEAVLDKGVDVNGVDSKGITALHVATIAYAPVDVVELLLDRGADANVKENELGETPIFFAVGLPNVRALALLINHGADLSLTNSCGSTLLHRAASSRRDIDIVHLLFRRGIINYQNIDTDIVYQASQSSDSSKQININAQNKLGDTALHCAAKICAKNSIKTLLDLGANTQLKNHNNQSALQLASLQGNLACTYLILQEDIKNHDNDTIHNYCYVLEAIADINMQNCEGKTLLNMAVEEGNMNLAGVLLRSGADVCLRNKEGLTVFHVAAEKGDVAMIRSLLCEGLKVTSKDEMSSDITKLSNLINAKTETGVTCLHIAAWKGHDELVRLLLNLGPLIASADCIGDASSIIDINAQTFKGWTALHCAAAGGFSGIVKLLLNNDGIDLSLTTNYETVLHMAVIGNSLECVDLILSKGIVNVNTQDCYECTALHLAVRLSNKDMVLTLINHGADLSLQNNLGETALHLAVSQVNNVELVELIAYNLADDRQKKTKTINTQDEKGLTALHLAVYKGNADIVKILLRNGADISIKSCLGKTALHMAVYRKNVNVVQMLLHESIQIDKEFSCEYELQISNDVKFLDYVINSQDKYKRTPLIMAIEQGSCEIVKILLEHGALIGINDNSNSTALHKAVSSLNCEILEHVLNSATKHVKMGYNFDTFDINAQDFRGNTSLHLAVKISNCDMVQSLLKNNADITLTNKKGQNAIHTAARIAQLDVLDLLLFKISDSEYLSACKPKDLQVSDIINAPDQKGFAPLHYAVLRRRKGDPGVMRVVEMLVKHGACNSGIKRVINVNVKDGEGNTALHIIVQSVCNDKAKIANFLIDNGSDLSQKNNYGQTPLQVACEWDIESRMNKTNYDYDISLELMYLLLRNEKRTELYSNTTLENGFITLRNCSRLNTQDYFGKALIHMAVENSDKYMIKSFIQYGADVNITDNDGNAPIHTAVKHDQLEIVDLLLSAATNKADVDLHNSNGYSPLHIAVKKDNSDMVRLLLRHGSNINIKLKSTKLQRNNNDLTTLHMAIEEDNLEMVKLLLVSGADVNLKTKDDLTALHIAVLFEHFNILECLLSQMTETKDNVNILGPSGKTCLHLAAEKASKPIVELLLLYSADLFIKTKNGQTPLHSVIMHSRYSNVRYDRLRDVSSIVTILLQEAEKVAGIDNNVAGVSRLCDYVNIKDNVGRTALHYVICEYGGDKYNVAKELISFGANLYEADSEGCTPFDLAINVLDENTLNLLLEEGLDIGYCDQEGWTLLMQAVWNCNDQVVKNLLNLGVDVNIKDKKGNTALHYASLGDISDILLCTGANTNETNNDGITPLYFTLKRTHNDYLTTFDLFDSLLLTCYMFDITTSVANATLDINCLTIDDRKNMLINVQPVLTLYKAANIMRHITDKIDLPTLSATMSSLENGSLENGILLEDELQDQISSELNIIYEGSCRETEVIKKTRIGGICLYSVLDFSLKDLKFTDNDECRTFLEGGEFESRFQYYGSLIKRRFNMAKDMYNLLEELSEMFSQTLTKFLAKAGRVQMNVPMEVSRLILVTIGPHDLMSLRDAFQ